MNRQSPIANRPTRRARSLLWLSCRAAALCVGGWLCGFAAPAPAATIRLAWDASPSPVTNIEYVLYAATNLISPTNIQAATVRVVVGTNLTANLDFTNAGRWYFVVTCFAGTTSGESVQSNQVIWDLMPPPANMRTVYLQYSGTLTNFYDVGFFQLRLP